MNEDNRIIRLVASSGLTFKDSCMGQMFPIFRTNGDKPYWCKTLSSNMCETEYRRYVDDKLIYEFDVSIEVPIDFNLIHSYILFYCDIEKFLLFMTKEEFDSMFSSHDFFYDKKINLYWKLMLDKEFEEKILDFSKFVFRSVCRYVESHTQEEITENMRLISSIVSTVSFYSKNQFELRKENVLRLAAIRYSWDKFTFKERLKWFWDHENKDSSCSWEDLETISNKPWKEISEYLCK